MAFSLENMMLTPGIPTMFSEKSGDILFVMNTCFAYIFRAAPPENISSNGVSYMMQDPFRHLHKNGDARVRVKYIAQVSFISPRCRRHCIFKNIYGVRVPTTRAGGTQRPLQVYYNLGSEDLLTFANKHMQTYFWIELCQQTSILFSYSFYLCVIWFDCLVFRLHIGYIFVLG